MTMHLTDEIALRPVVPRAEEAYRGFLIVALLLATLLGFVLAIHVPVERLLKAGSAERTIDLIQAHGQVQLLGFSGLYVMGMSLRLLPRFAGARLAFEPLTPLLLWSMVAALVTRAVVMPWFSGDMHAALLLASDAGVLLGSSVYLLIVGATLRNDARHVDASSLAFAIGAATLFATSVIALLVSIDAIGDGDRSLPYLADSAIVQLQMVGFILVVITGVALRALPTIVGLTRPLQGSRIAPVGLSAAAVVLATALLFLQYSSYGTTVVRIAGVAFAALGVVLLAFVWWAGVLRPAANRIRPASQPQLWLVRGAFAWLLVAGGLATWAGITGFVSGELPSQFDFDAVRHSLAVGVITNLILGMSLLILPEFAAERQHQNQQRRLALLLAGLVNLSALLRVVPAAAGTAWSFDDRNLSIALAGSLAELAMLVFAAYFLRLVWRARRLRSA